MRLAYFVFVFKKLQRIWRNLNGETAYQRYLDHWHSHHASSDEEPMSRRAFFASETQRKWSGIKRCC